MDRDVGMARGMTIKLKTGVSPDPEAPGASAGSCETEKIGTSEQLP